MDKTVRIKQATYDRLKKQSEGFESVDEVIGRLLDRAESGYGEEAMEVVRALEAHTRLTYTEWEEIEGEEDEESSTTIIKSLAELTKDAIRVRDEHEKAAKHFLKKIQEPGAVTVNDSAKAISNTLINGDLILIRPSHTVISNNIVQGYMLTPPPDEA